MVGLTTEQAKTRLQEAANGPEFAGLRTALRRLGVDDAALVRLVTAINERLATQTELLRLRGAVSPHAEALPFALERLALLVTAIHYVPELTTLPIPPDVIELMLDEFAWLAAPRDNELPWFEAGTYKFSAIAKLVTLRRYPAGQLHWEISGFPRSTFLRVKGFDRLRLLRGVWQLGGLAPLIVPHQPWRPLLALLESQQYVAYFRMARAMRRQPAIRGLIAQAWFHAPDVARGNPHLTWTNRIFERWGGVVVHAGPAGEDSGVFERSARRRQLAAEGKLVPQLGLVIWPRDGMLRWAEHYERDREAAGKAQVAGR